MIAHSPLHRSGRARFLHQMCSSTFSRFQTLRTQFIHISNGRLHDVNVLDMLPVEAGSFYVMDHGCVDFKRLYAMHQVGAFFVTRAKAGMDLRGASTRTPWTVPLG